MTELLSAEICFFFQLLICLSTLLQLIAIFIFAVAMLSTNCTDHTITGGSEDEGRQVHISL